MVSCALKGRPFKAQELEAKFVRKSPISRLMRWCQKHLIPCLWSHSVSKSTIWTLTMSKSITSCEIDGPPSFLAVQAADGLLSHIALLVSFQYSFPHNARE